MAQGGQVECNGTQKRAAALSALPVSDPFAIVLGEIIASGLRGSSTRHGGVPSVARSILHADVAALPNVLSARHTHSRPNGGIRRPKCNLRRDELHAAPRRLSVARSLQPLQPAWRRDRGQTPTRSLTEVYSFNAPCWNGCTVGSLLTFLHRLSPEGST